MERCLTLCNSEANKSTGARFLFGDKPMKLHHQPTLTLFCGLPGSGKTTLAKRLEQIGKGIRICTDDWQEHLGHFFPLRGTLQGVLVRIEN